MEDGKRFAIGLEATVLHASSGEHFNPLDVVLGGHGMPFAAHLDAISRACGLDSGQVFLDRGICDIFLHPLHGLATAMQVAGTALHHLYDGSAYGASVNFSFLCHTFRSFIGFGLYLYNDRNGGMVQRG